MLELDRIEIEEEKINDQAIQEINIDVWGAYRESAGMKAEWENEMRYRKEDQEKERDRKAYHRKIYNYLIQKKLIQFQAEIKAEINAQIKAKARIQAERERKKTESELMEIKKNRIPQFCRRKFF